MTRPEASALATHIVKTANGNMRLKIGQTNGRACIHLRHVGQSETIYSQVEWNLHRWNLANRPARKQDQVAA